MNAAVRLVVAPIRAYQRVVSPLLGPRCRFQPSCSEYAVGALERHGLGRGAYLAIRRIARCHPFNPGGLDDVPARFSWRRTRVASGHPTPDAAPERAAHEAGAT